MMIATLEAGSVCSLSHRERDGATRERGHTVEAPGFPSPRASARRGGVRGGGPLSTRSFSTPHPARCSAPRHPPHRFAGGGYLLSRLATDRLDKRAQLGPQGESAEFAAAHIVASCPFPPRPTRQE